MLYEGHRDSRIHKGFELGVEHLALPWPKKVGNSIGSEFFTGSNDVLWSFLWCVELQAVLVEPSPESVGQRGIAANPLEVLHWCEEINLWLRAGALSGTIVITGRSDHRNRGGVEVPLACATGVRGSR